MALGGRDALFAATAADPDEDTDDEKEGSDERSTLSTDDLPGSASHLDLVLNEKRGKGVVVQRGQDLGGVRGATP